MDTPNLHDDSTRVHLLGVEKDAIRESILRDAPVSVSVPSPFYPHLRFIQAPAFALVLLLVAGVPLTYAAQKSGPGDFLYPLEARVIERVEASLQLSPSNKISYHSDRLAERLEEIQTIDELDTNSMRGIRLSVSLSDNHARTVRTALSSERDAEDRIDVLLAAAALLKAQENVIRELGADTEDIDEVEDSATEVLDKNARSFAEGRSDEALIADIDEEIEATQTLVEAAQNPTLEAEVADSLFEVAGELAEGNIVEAYLSVLDIQEHVLIEEHMSEKENEPASADE